MKFPLKKLLVPLAAWSRAAVIASQAISIAHHIGAEVFFLHVGDDSARELLLKAIPPEHHSKLYFRHGRPGREILKAARELKVDLVVLGALQSETALKYYVSSIARQVAREADCSVLLLAEPELCRMESEHWGVAVPEIGELEPMLKLMSHLAQFAKPKKIDVIREYSLSGADLTLDDDFNAAVARAKSFENQLLEELKTSIQQFDFANAEVRPLCLRGRTGAESAAYARREHVDMLMVEEPHKLTFLDRFFQHGTEFALESLPKRLWICRAPKYLEKSES